VGNGQTLKGNGSTKLKNTGGARIASKAQVEDGGPEDDNDDGSDDIIGKRKSKVAPDQQSSRSTEAKSSSLPRIKLKAKPEQAKEVEALNKNDEVYLRVRVQETKSGKQALKLLEVLPIFPKVGGPDRRKSDLRNSRTMQKSTRRENRSRRRI